MEDFDIIISGAGLVGMTLSILLAKFNLRILILEKNNDIYNFSKDIYIDNESMRIWKSCGLNIDKYICANKISKYAKICADSLNKMRKDLLEILKAKGINILFNHKLIDFKDGKDHVLVKCDNSEEIKILKAKYLIACDGRKSFIRKKLGLKIKCNKLFSRSNISDLRMANSYSKGNVFLAGDAAHVITYLQQRGLNIGLKDISNISWKLSKVISGIIDKDLLRTYEVERKYNKANRIRKSIKCFIEKGKLSGKYFPQLVSNNGLEFDEILGDDFAVITINSNEEDFLPSEELECWKDLEAKFIRLSEKGAKHFENFIDVNKKHLFVIRPDKFIYKHIEK